MKKNSDIAVGNVVGSNIFNVLGILGFSAFIFPTPFSSSINFDIFSDGRYGACFWITLHWIKIAKRFLHFG